MMQATAAGGVGRSKTRTASAHRCSRDIDVQIFHMQLVDAEIVEASAAAGGANMLQADSARRR